MSQIGKFTSKASFYHHRWNYALPAIDAICAAIGGANGKKIADLGAGNGALSKHFLARGADVYAVEPNKAMLPLAQAALNHYPTFHPICAPAEDTKLPAHTMDAIVVGRALHWFAPQEASQEIRRIIKPNGLLAILHVPPANKHIREALLSVRSAKNGWDMTTGGTHPPAPPHALYFGHHHYQKLQFSQVISQSWPEFWGNLCSRSSSPDISASQIERFRQEAYTLFEILSHDGLFTIETLTTVSLGTITE